MFSFMVLTKGTKEVELRKAEEYFLLNFNSKNEKFISGFSLPLKMSLTYGPNSMQFSIYDKEVPDEIKEMITKYLKTELEGEIEGIYVEKKTNKYSFLENIISKELVIS
jgi:hypothetical protein